MKITKLDRYQALCALCQSLGDEIKNRFDIDRLTAIQQDWFIKFKHLEEALYIHTKDWTNEENADILDFQAYRKRRGRL